MGDESQEGFGAAAGLPPPSAELNILTSVLWSTKIIFSVFDATEPDLR